MLKRSLWDELRPKWPMAATTGWDHWMRLTTTHKGRECIAPVVPRTKHIATHGTNVKTKAQVHRYDLFAFATTQAHLDGFGDVTRLYLGAYDASLRTYVWQHCCYPATRMIHRNIYCVAGCSTLECTYVLTFVCYDL